MNASDALWIAVTWTIGGVLIAVIAAIIERKRSDAALRHWTWLMALSATALLPLLAVMSRFLHECGSGAPGASGACLNHPASPAIPNAAAGLALTVWAAGTIWIMARALLALRAIRTWKARSVRYEHGGGLQLNARADIRIATGELPQVPITFGILRPVILLPRNARTWERSRIEAILWHEIGHARRRDNLWQILSLGLCALHWFNPLIWFAARRMEAASEIAADDFAITRGLKPSTYAAELLAVARELRGGPLPFSMAHTAMAKPFTLDERLQRIVSRGTLRGSSSWFGYGKVFVVFAALAAALNLALPALAALLPLAEPSVTPSCLVPPPQSN